MPLIAAHLIASAWRLSQRASRSCRQSAMTTSLAVFTTGRLVPPLKGIDFSDGRPICNYRSQIYWRVPQRMYLAMRLTT